MTKLEPLNKRKIIATDYSSPDRAGASYTVSFSRTHKLLLGLITICVLFLVLISMARSIQIETVSSVDGTPISSAKVDITSWFSLPLGNRVLVFAGSLPIRVTATGYASADETLEVANGQHQLFSITLVPLPGKLDVLLSPAIKASVLMDGKPIGDLPGIIADIPVGTHTFVFDAPLYRAATAVIDIIGRDTTQKLAVEMQAAWAELSLQSSPSGASVMLGGRIAGTTPLTLKLEEGQHQLGFVLEKYADAQRVVEVVALRNMQLPLVELKPANGQLQISSQPSGAALLLNDEYQGATPITLSLSPNKQHALQIYKPGYQMHAQKISMQAAQQLSQSVPLQQHRVPVRFSLSPADAQLLIDGKRYGTGNQTVDLGTLPHTVEVHKAGYVSHKTEIIPTAHGVQIVSIKLLTSAQQFWAKQPGRYTNKQGLSFKLFKSPGKVVMGSPRREAGRRANEATYSAQLSKAFYVGLNEVSNKQFRRFNAKHNAGNYKRKSLDSNKFPVVNVSWQQAALYCNWLSQQEGLQAFYSITSGYVSGNIKDSNGYRLPTEAEWSWLARQSAGSASPIVYPWGSQAQVPAEAMGNFADLNALGLLTFTLKDYDDGYVASAPVGRFKANAKGLFDMGSNVSEWVNDWYVSNPLLDNPKSGPLIDPLGPEVGEFHVVRGASWAKGYLPQLRLAYRDYAAKGRHDIGFRVARYVGSPKK